VYSLPAEDSLEALQMALSMIVVQLESYQREHGLTPEGDEYLGLIKPDFEGMRKELEASPYYGQVRDVLDQWDCGRAFLRSAIRPVREEGET